MAVCVRQWDWSETSQTVSLLGRDSGVVRAVAKGAKRKDARFSGGLETLACGEMVVILKNGPALATLTDWDLRETFPALRSSLSAFHAGMFLADLVQHGLTDQDPHPAVFDALLAALRALGADPVANHLAALRFQWAILSDTGYRPELEADVHTGEVLRAATSYGFSPHRGGLTKDPGEEPAERPPVWRTRRQTVDLLRNLDSGAPVEASTVLRASRLLGAYHREILGRDIPAMAAFLGPAEAGQG
jgi:DNA repair protein RecO (recombination protein O)